jgi:hypothetical protein
LLLLAVQLVAYLTGYCLGRWRSRYPGNQPESVAVVVGGMLALLAFVLALTLSFASARYGERRTGALAEANAIGTAWLRAEAVGGERGKEIGRLLEQYAQVREDYARAERDRAATGKLNQRTNILQSAIWGHLTAIIADQPGPLSVSLMSALNETFDASAAERFAFGLRLPSQIFWLLIALTLVTAACLGYQLGIKGTNHYILVLLLSVMWTAVIVNILDLASPRLGNFRTDISPYRWTIQGFKGGVTVPPLLAVQ